MSKKIFRVVAIILALAMVLTSFGFAMLFPASAATVDEVANDELNVAQFKNFITYVHDSFKDYVTYDELMDGAYAGIIDALGDRFSIYFESVEEGDTFTTNVRGEYFGIGVTVQPDSSLIKITAVTMGSPAEKAGIKPGDIIKSVNGESMEGKAYSYCTSKIKDGPAGSEVTLVIERAGIEKSYKLKRAKLNTKSIKYEMLDDGIGYVIINSIDTDTDKEFAGAIAELNTKGMKGLVVDLRDNPGGIVNTAIALAAEFVEEESTIMTYERRGKVDQTFTAKGNGAKPWPVALIVNEGTASAAEILTGAWQDLGVATVVGTTTYGKGIAQKSGKVMNGKTVNLSVYYFKTPLGRDIHQIGIEPDVMIANNTGLGMPELEAVYADFAPMTEDVKYAYGESGMNVYGAQQRLKMLGYDVQLSGSNDDKTFAAIKKFQHVQGLYSYGTLDITTKDKLEFAAQSAVFGDIEEDLQLDKAIEIVKEEMAKAEIAAPMKDTEQAEGAVTVD